jgi:hypothetical protein
LVQIASEAGAVFDTPLLDFGDVKDQTSSAMRTLRFRNAGASPLEIGATVTPRWVDQFVVVADGCGGTVVDPGGVCTLDVEYRPGRTGFAAGALALFPDADACSALLVGRGVP